MTIVYILNTFPSYSEYFILNEIDALRAKGFRIVIASVKKGPPVQAASGNEVFYARLFSPSAHLYFLRRSGRRYRAVWKETLSDKKAPGALRAWKHFSLAIYFLYRLRKVPIDRLHAHFLSLPASIALIMSKLSGIGCSCSAHAHDIFTTDKAELQEKINTAKMVITCTEFNLSYLKALVPAEAAKRIHHVYHGIDLSKWPKREGFHPFKNGIHLLTVGRLVEKKGTIYLLQAVERLKTYGTIQCSIIGDGPLLPYLKAFVEQHQLEGNVHFHGALEQEKIKSLYEAADLFVLPCIETNEGDQDGLPNVLMEALATGVPVISTVLSAIPELIEDKATGLLLPQADAESIAKAVLHLKDNRPLYEELLTNGWEKIKKFDIRLSTEKLAQLFSEP